MDALNILLHPQLAGKKSESIKDFDDELREFLCLMFFTMDTVHGVGLAAPQVNWFRRVAVVHVPDEDPVALINPRIVEAEGKMSLREGCLSLPGRGFVAMVERAAKVTVEYQDAFGEKKCLAECTGMLAQAIQHEVDHLDGKFYIDHLPRFQRSLLIEKLKKRIHARERDIRNHKEHEKREQKIRDASEERQSRRLAANAPRIMEAPEKPVGNVELTDGE